MHYSQIVEKFSGYFLVASEGLALWLNTRLKLVDSNNWWATCVIEKISEHQRGIVEALPPCQKS